MKKFSSRIRAFLRFTIEIKNGCEILFRVKEERKLDFKLIKRIKPSRVKYLVVNRFNLIVSLEDIRISPVDSIIQSNEWIDNHDINTKPIYSSNMHCPTERD